MMSSSLDLEFDLLAAAGVLLSVEERRAIQTFVDSPELHAWIAAGNVVVQESPNRATLASLLIKRYKHYIDNDAYLTINNATNCSMWHRFPDPEHIVAIIKAQTKTDTLPPIALELELARSTDAKLEPHERRALERLYYRPTVDHLNAAKDIVLLEEGNPDGLDLTFIEAVALVAPEWIERNVGEDRRGDRLVKTFKAAPPWNITQAALVRATH